MSAEQTNELAAPPPVPNEAAGKKATGKKDDGQDDKASAYAQLSRVMWLLFVRDKAAVFFFLIFPLMFLLLFGTLFKGSTTAHSNIAQVGSIQMLDRVTGADRTQLDKALTITRMTDEAAALQRVKDGKLDGLIEQGPGNTLMLRYSSIDPTKAATVNGILKSVIQTANVEATGKPPTFTLEAAQVEDNSVKSIQYLTPGLLGWAVASSGVFSTALTMVLLRRKGVLRRIRLAPMSVTSVVTSRIGVSVVMALTQTAIFLSVATLPFLGLQLTGNWWLVIPLVICATISFMSIGLLIGSIAKSEEAVNGVAQLIVLPMSFLSGSFFSLGGAPGWVKAVSDVMPLRYFVTACENILSRGGGIGDALPTMGGLLLFAVVLTGISLRLFSWDDV